MKRVLITLFSLSLMLSFCACQFMPPEVVKAVPAQTNTERLIETVKTSVATTGEKSLPELYGIPAEYEYEARSDNGKLNIKVNANVVVPSDSKIPIYRVKAANFTQGQVTAFWNEFIGDTEMWNEQRIQTKEQIQAYIRDLKELMTDEERLSEYTLMNMEEAQEELARLERQYQAAPGVNEETRADNILDELFAYENEAEQSGKKFAAYTGISAYEKANTEMGQGKCFFVHNNYDLKKGIVTGRDKQGNPTRMYSVSRSATLNYSDYNNAGARRNYYYETATPVPVDTALERNLMSKTGLSPKDAAEQAQTFLDKTVGNMAVHRVFLLRDELSGEIDANGMQIVRPAEQYAYFITCVRTVGGVPASYIQGLSIVGDYKDQNPTAAYWGYETLNITVNKEGIVSMGWTAPLEVTETVNGDSQLKPFSEIREIFEKMMFVKYEADAEIGMGDTYEINRVELSLHRIAEQNSYENGLLVPAWNFYGKKTQKADGILANIAFNESFMSINAIDGTVIDIEQGY